MRSFAIVKYVVLPVSPILITKLCPGTWKFNTSLLQNEEYTSKVKTFWLHWRKRKSSFKDLNIWWDIGKKKLKHLSIIFSRKLAKGKHSASRKLESQVNDLVTSNSHKDNIKRIKKVSQDILNVDNKAVEGAKIRSNERFYTEFEKPSQYFFNLENSHQSSKVISTLKKIRSRYIPLVIFWKNSPLSMKPCILLNRWRKNPRQNFYLLL